MTSHPKENYSGDKHQDAGRWDDLFDYFDGVERRDPGLLQLEAETHQAFTPWIGNHIDKSGGKIQDAGYDSGLQTFENSYSPHIKTFQRLDEGFTPPRPIPLWVPNFLVVRGIKRGLAKELGSMEKAEHFTNVFKQTEAYPGADNSISEEVYKRFRQKETTALLVDHLKKGDLRDVALAAAGLLGAIGKKSVRSRTATVLGLNMSRQNYEDRNMAETILKIMGIIWVMQDTDNRKALPIPKEAVKIVDEAADEAFDELRSKGAIVAEVPAGTTAVLTQDKSGRPKYIRPTVRGAVAGLMRMDAFLPVAAYEDDILPGPMEVAENPKRLERKDKKVMVVRALTSLAINDAVLTGIPVQFEDLRSRDSFSIAYPSRRVEPVGV